MKSTQSSSNIHERGKIGKSGEKLIKIYTDMKREINCTPEREGLLYIQAPGFDTIEDA